MNEKLSPKLKRYIGAVVAGTSLECYDFAIFGYFAPIFSQQFFPTTSVYTSLMGTFAIFAVGFLSRPFGAYLFGKLGDQQGRKHALLISMFLMAVSTCLMGLLPTYQQVGVWAPILLLSLRIFQGISLGGEHTGGLSFMLEHAPANQRGFVGSWMYIGSTSGMFLGALVSALTTLMLSTEQLLSWGWRMPFLLGFGIAILGFYLRRRVEETPLFLELQKTNTIERQPFIKVFSEHGRDIVQVVCILFPNTVWTYLLFVYLPAYLTRLMHWDFSLSLTASLLPMLAFIPLIPFAGRLSDLWGRRKVMTLGLGAITLIAPFAFPVFATGDLLQVVLLQVIIAAILSFSAAPTAALLAEKFPTRLRNTGMAISYQIATGVFGGMTPLIVTWLTSLTTATLGPTFWVMIAGVAGLVALSRLPETDEYALEV